MPNLLQEHKLRGGPMARLLEGKKVLVTGVLDRRSIAYSAARLAVEQGAEIALTGFGRAMSLTERTAKRLDPVPPVFELDVNKPEDINAVADVLKERWGEVHGILHSIAFAPEEALGGNFLSTEWSSVAEALQTSAYSLKALAVGLMDLMKPGASIVGLDFDARVAWPAYDWMGVAKAALESTCRYLARDLGPRGIRVNLISAGPLRTLAAKGISGFEGIEGEWERQTPLGWSTADTEPVGKAVVSLLSDWWPATTGELIHVDGGYHAMGAPIKD
jgi:meromycolic acid enoyl-[acyl-carrier protein] reductase